MLHQLTIASGREYDIIHSPEALAPRKREALTPSVVRALIRAVDGRRINLRVFTFVPHGSWLARNIKGALALSGCGGFDLAEVALVDGAPFSAMKILGALLFFIIDGEVKISLSASELKSMRRGRDRVGVLACAAENGPLVIHFLSCPIAVNLNPDGSEDPRLILRDLALYCPVRSEDLRSTPLFTNSENREALG
jgi:hypothetical protein